MPKKYPCIHAVKLKLTSHYVRLVAAVRYEQTLSLLAEVELVLLVIVRASCCSATLIAYRS